MKVNLTRCEFSGGPAHGERVFLARPVDFRIGAAAFVVKAGEGGAHQYELAGPDAAKGLLYAHAGQIEPGADDDDADAEHWSARGVEAIAPDGAPARKARVFFDGGPADGVFVFLLFPPSLEPADVLFEYESEAGAGRTHVYERVPAWQEPADLAPDAMVFRHVEIEAASAT